MTPPATLPQRTLGRDGPAVSVMAFGLMGLGSVAYGKAGTEEERLAVLDRAWELGCINWDTADGYGDSEDLVGKWFKLHPERRQDIFLATKFGIKVVSRGDKGEWDLGVDSTPEYARQACEKSLERLGVDKIDLFYIHRLDEKTPIEKTMEALVQLKAEGKIGHIGISECSSKSLRRAYAVEPVAAVQVEYNPWSREIEGERGTNLLATCRELGVSVFCYSPLGRGILTGRFTSSTVYAADDFRNQSPRFSAENMARNEAIIKEFTALAEKKGCTPGQLALAWLTAQGDDVIPIPGTKSIKYLEENVGAANVLLTADEEREVRALCEGMDMAGHRNPQGFLNEYADTPEL